MAATPKTKTFHSKSSFLAPAAAALVLAAAVWAAYLPAVSAGTIWDDDRYLTENPLLDDFGGLARIWVPGNTDQYYPAVFTAFWIENQVWGAEPAGFHIINILLHALNAILVWRLCRLLRVPGAWFIAAVFALHPVHVESVAWISERKNVMSAFFYLLSAMAYLHFEDQRECGAPRAWRWYAAALALFVPALLSKTVTCSIPAALILMMLWRRRRLSGRRLAPLAPMFAAGLVLALHTAFLERTHVGAVGADFDFGLAERRLIACKALVFYPQKLLVPWPLIFIYPRWRIDPSDALAWWPAAVLLAAAAASIAAYRRGRRGPALALAFFVGTIFPALGFFNVYPMRFSFVADHFQYLASLGLIALAVGAAASCAPRRLLMRVAGAAVMAGLGVLTWSQCKIYADEETLWRNTLERNPQAWIAHNNLGEALAIRGSHDEALDRLLERLGRDAEAEGWYRQALPGSARREALLPFGVHLTRRGRPGEAAVLLEELAAARPNDADVLMFLSDAFAAAGRPADAIAAAERGLVAARARGDERIAGLIEKRIEDYRRARHAGGAADWK